MRYIIMQELLVVFETACTLQIVLKFLHQKVTPVVKIICMQNLNVTFIQCLSYLYFQQE